MCMFNTLQVIICNLQMLSASMPGYLEKNPDACTLCNHFAFVVYLGCYPQTEPPCEHQASYRFSAAQTHITAPVWSEGMHAWFEFSYCWWGCCLGARVTKTAHPHFCRCVPPRIPITYTHLVTFGQEKRFVQTLPS